MWYSNTVKIIIIPLALNKVKDWLVGVTSAVPNTNRNTVRLMPNNSVTPYPPMLINQAEHKTLRNTYQTLRRYRCLLRYGFLQSSTYPLTFIVTVASLPTLATSRVSISNIQVETPGRFQHPLNLPENLNQMVNIELEYGF